MARYSRIAFAIVTFLSPIAAADGWLVAEAPAAIAVSDATAGVFRPGVMPAIGVYADNQRFAIGARMRFGVLRNGPAPDATVEDPGIGGLTTATVAMRIGTRGAWLEVGGGGGITGRDLVPAFEAGVGFMMRTGSISIGPSVRYVRVVSNDPMTAFGTAELALVGIDVQFGKQRPVRREPPARIVVAPPPPPIPAARDADPIADRDASCASDLAGCRLTDDLIVIDDRIVLDERVLFDVDRARVRSRGRAVIGDLVRIWRETPAWHTFVVEGHADVRGTDEYNLRLSQLRADRVRAYMISLGCDPARITAIGHGRSRPRATGTGEATHQRNRRVEFVIERQHTSDVTEWSLGGPP
jgi:outer membrane protein OmpA-like peptidoglycan-associated protein